jgi:hypothetical protein
MAMVAATLLWGCNTASGPESGVNAPPTSSSPGPALAAKTQQNLLSLRDGKPDFELVPQGSNLEVRCGSTTYTSKIEADRVKVLSGDKLVAKVKQKKEGFELEDGSGARVLRVKVKAGPSLKVEDGKDKVLFQIDASGPALTVRSGDGGPRGSVQKGSQGLEWLDATKKVRASLQGTDVLAVGLVLPLESVTPEQRAALALYLAEVGP